MADDREITYLGSQELAWTDSDGVPWSLTFHFGDVDGAAEVIGCDVRGFLREGDRWVALDDDGPHPLRATTVTRDLPFGAKAQRAREFARDLRGEPLAEWLEGRAEEIRKAAEAQVEAFEASAPRTRRRRWTTKALADVAAVYTGALASGEPPTQAVAEAFEVTHSMAAKVVTKARGAGMLPPTKQGKARGLPPARKEDTNPQ